MKMYKKRKESFTHLGVYMSAAQSERLWRAYERSGEKSMSEYVRKILFRQPVMVFWRDKGYDEFIETAIRLKKELAGVLSQKIISEATEQELLNKMTALLSIVINIEAYVRENQKNGQSTGHAPIQ
jgi:hypothetical protein